MIVNKRDLNSVNNNNLDKEIVNQLKKIVSLQHVFYSANKDIKFVTEDILYYKAASILKKTLSHPHGIKKLSKKYSTLKKNTVGFKNRSNYSKNLLRYITRKLKEVELLGVTNKGLFTGLKGKLLLQNAIKTCQII